jgi:hypothetical protein
MLENTAIFLNEYSNGSPAFLAVAGLAVLRKKHKEQA